MHQSITNCEHLIIQQLSIMLSNKSQKIFTRHHTLEDYVAEWCRFPSAQSPRQKNQYKLKTPKQKISIKQLKNVNKMHAHAREDTEALVSSNNLKITQKNIGLSAHSKIETKLKFTYNSNTNRTNLSPSPFTHVPSYYPMSNYMQNDSQSLCQPQQNQISNYQEATTQLEGDLAKTVKRQTFKVAKAEEQIVQLPPAFPNLVKVNTASTNQSHRRQKSQLVQKTSSHDAFDQGFAKPRPKNFERGSLFTSVRKSQTINTDVKSESESSIVIEDYKSLMSKIQENHLEEEEFQEI